MSTTNIRQPYFSFKEFSKLTNIAWPLILSSLVTMSISITDVVMIGQLGTLELAAAAAASDYYSVFYYLAAGVAAAISPMIAQARGQRRFRNIKTIWLQGFVASFLIGIVAALAIFLAPTVLGAIGVKSDIVDTGAPYAQVMALTLFPMLAVSVMHYFLSATNHTRIILYVTAAALPVNILGNYLFLYGSWGAPELGVAGAALSSMMTGIFMFVCLLSYALRKPQLRRYLHFPVQLNAVSETRKEIFRLGLPIGVSHFGEMGVFLFATVSMGIFGAEVLAAHTITLRLAGVLYAIPIAYAQAAMVRIGYLAGRQDQGQLDQAIRTLFVFSIFAGIGLFILVFSSKSMIPGLFIDAEQLTSVVTSQTSLFLLMLGLMQPTIILGTIGGGVLRGFKDSKSPMIYSLLCYWGLGFVGAWLLALGLDLGGLGFWIGLLAATAAFALLTIRRIVEKRRMQTITPLAAEAIA